MSKILGLVTIFAFIVVASSLTYDFQVSLANIKNPDGDLNGTLKVYVLTTNKTKDFLRLNETTLKQGFNYTSRVDYPHQAAEISNLTFQFTLSSPYPPKFLFRKPSIYLHKITVIPTYIQNPQFRFAETKSFCPKNEKAGTKHKDILDLYRCSN